MNSHRMRTQGDTIRHRELLGEEFTGQCVVKILRIDIDNNRKQRLLLEIDNKFYYIKRPQNKTWHHKERGDVFIVTKLYTKTDIAKLDAGRTYQNNNGTCDIGTINIYSLFNSDNTKPYIVGLKIMESEPNHYVVYHNKKTYRVTKDFTFTNPYDLELGKNIKCYLDISDDKTKVVPVLGLNFNDARKKYLEVHGQSKDELKTFDIEPLSKDKYIDYHKISNIELVSRKFQGLVLIQPIELTTSIQDGELRKYITARINGKDIVQLKISKHGLWNSVNGKDALLVRKRIDPADDGKDLARLTILNQTSNYNDMELISLNDLLKHKHGTKVSVDFDVVYANNEYVCVYADDELYKISISSVNEKFIDFMKRGQTMYRIKDGEQSSEYSLYTRKTQTRLLF